MDITNIELVVAVIVWLLVMWLYARSECGNIRRTPKEREEDNAKRA